MLLCAAVVAALRLEYRSGTLCDLLVASALSHSVLFDVLCRSTHTVEVVVCIVVSAVTLRSVRAMLSSSIASRPCC
jgi:hypothetical protein